MFRLFLCCIHSSWWISFPTVRRSKVDVYGNANDIRCDRTAKVVIVRNSIWAHNNVPKRNLLLCSDPKSYFSVFSIALFCCKHVTIRLCEGGILFSWWTSWSELWKWVVQLVFMNRAELPLSLSWLCVAILEKARIKNVGNVGWNYSSNGLSKS